MVAVLVAKVYAMANRYLRRSLIVKKTEVPLQAPILWFDHFFCFRLQLCIVNSFVCIRPKSYSRPRWVLKLNS